MMQLLGLSIKISGRRFENFEVKMPRMAFLASWDRRSHRRGEKLSNQGLLIFCEGLAMETFDTKTTGTNYKKPLILE